MKNKNVKGIIALAVVTALSFGVILGSRSLSHNINGNTENNEAGSVEQSAVLEELDVSGAENIEKAVKTENGYVVTVKTKGYASEILMNVSFDADAKNITGVEVVEQGETENFGARIAEPEFLSQFEGVAAPVYLPGMTLDTAAGEDAGKVEDTIPEEAAVLTDGTYEAKSAEADANGFVEEFTMTVEGGKIVSANWDCVDADGNKKSDLSESGSYVMTEDGPTWKEQSEALSNALVEGQTIASLGMNEEGKTDAVSGVSINIMGFAGLAEQCINEAAGNTSVVEENKEETPAAPQNGTQVDGISGATISSTAAVKGINAAYDFLQTVK